MSVSTAPVPSTALPLAPGPRFATPFGFLREVRRDLLGFLERAHAEY